MKEAGDSVKKAVSEEIEDRYEDVLEDLYSKELAMYNLHERQVVQLEKEIAVEPPPKQRYTKRTIELRHAEKSLSQQQDFFNAARVRAKTKELELVCSECGPAYAMSCPISPPERRCSGN